MKNREIKFRFWLSHIGKMTKAHDLFEIGKVIVGPLDSIIPLQYTGLNDKFGVEIYEGDVIDYGADESPEVVSYYNNLSAFYLGNCMFFEYGTEHFKVIGNIYENPELIEQ